MPKKNKYPWYKARDCFRVQKKLPDGGYKTLYAKTEVEMDVKVRQLEQELSAGLDSENNPTVAQYVIGWVPLNTAELSPARVRDYKVAINKYIAPIIATKKCTR